MSERRVLAFGSMRLDMTGDGKMEIEDAQAIYRLRGMWEKVEKPIPGETIWAFPVGTAEYPPEAWYAATLHDTTGRLNNGYCHTGIDLNLDRSPWGDVDRGQPVFAVADAEIVGHSCSTQGYLGSIVIKVMTEWDGATSLHFRYWHLANDSTFDKWQVGSLVGAGTILGHIGPYARGDHLHFDCAKDAFGPHWWFTRHPEVEWIDPVPVLKRHLDTKRIKQMLEKEVG
jgi:hypothetical protein